ncbi:hypothetical protein OSTOST_18181, partial [Ostertagia ostertagi]
KIHLLFSGNIQGACNIQCQQGFRCVLVEPANCNGCQPQAQCVQQECDTNCRQAMPIFNTCVLQTSTSGCCPVGVCRSQFSVSSTPQYSSNLPFTNTPSVTQLPFTSNPFTFNPFPFPFFPFG